MSKKHIFEVKEGLETRVLTKAKAIRFHCLSCCGFSPSEVTKCTCHTCALFPFRFGNEKGLDTKYYPEDFDSNGDLINGEEADSEEADSEDEEIDWDDDDD